MGLLDVFLFFLLLSAHNHGSLEACPNIAPRRRYLSDNLLSGGIPPEFGNITTLVLLDLSDNHLSGVIPHELGSLVNNEFSGELPKSFAALEKMVNLFITGNNFSGKIPEYIANRENLTVLYAADIENNEGMDFPFPNLSGMTSLTWLTLRNCSITGRIPEFILQMISPYYLDLSFNNFTGEIQTSVTINDSSTCKEATSAYAPKYSIH
ncbi:PREDICTED: probable leucine-rich repeat receptor-like serine/threonine-protein kinase At3g14840 isoform X2 [Populus euphratica]|uniref:Probable leucine-rich repeat receptor-like serine/threonine-protein kinase At3g14840 isoform X2 n=1 Tax=Populus euphratica TaxID=75702 RepID=A0AAJ6TF48_POPEU|nr:PREDICTED: probable leucine-rich repeat receptor-like serine/threonine-protein kinase At3g14840 isoform X2 [Populus euphratica]XP_011009670.1 PREDICTED: probable leucine-rich repeat receptor-like serine/threonine-protein kinase At3g14840 isoform X2 [Populus euphratica]